MTGFELTLTTENAAFHPGPEFETARILRTIARRLEDGCKEGNCLDANGNAVGTFKVLRIPETRNGAKSRARRKSRRL